MVRGEGVLAGLKLQQLSAYNTCVASYAIELAQLFHACSTLFGDAFQRLALLHFVVLNLACGVCALRMSLSCCGFRLARCAFLGLAGLVAGALAVALNVLPAVSAARSLAAQGIGALGVSGVAVLMISVEVAGDVLIGEVEEECGVQSVSAKARFEVQVRAGGASCIASEADGLTSLDGLIGAYQLF